MRHLTVIACRILGAVALGLLAALLILAPQTSGTAPASVPEPQPGYQAPR